MYIEPNSTVRLLFDIPLNSDYHDTLYWDTPQAQTNYFLNHEGKTYNNLTYARTSASSFKIQDTMRNVFNCNYMMFRNNSFENKWFYAFVNEVNYINNETCEIVFTIDVVQTWFFEMKQGLGQCFIERQHSLTDEIGDNIIEERFDINEYQNSDVNGTGFFDDYTFVIVSPYRLVGSALIENYFPSFVTGNPSSLTSYYVRGNTTEETLNALQAMLLIFDQAGKTDSITTIYMIPNSFVPTIGTVYDKLPYEVVEKDTVLLRGIPTRLGSYVPRNKKLLTYPYYKVVITTMDGVEHEYAREFFTIDGQITENIEGTIYANLTANCSFKFVPKNYKGTENNFVESVTLDDIPMVAWKSNSFNEWLARNKTRLSLQSGTSLVSALKGYNQGFAEINAGFMMRNKNNAISKKGGDLMSKGATRILDYMPNPYEAIGSIVSSTLTARKNGVQSNGSTDGSLEVAMGQKDFNVYTKWIMPQYAEMIDDYFDMFGYAMNIIGVPELKARQNWTYVKTIGAEVHGKIPVEHSEQIEEIFNSGVRFWTNPNNVGNYTLGNSPLR